jgi:hypothetical protein
MHTTNYTSALIAPADDCKAAAGTLPPAKDEPTVAQLQFEMISAHPYRYTSDEIIFEIHARRNGIPAAKREAARHEFFSKGQPCMRSSPLAKTYGWGFHFDAEARVAIYGRESAEFKKLNKDASLKQLKAMRSRREK